MSNASIITRLLLNLPKMSNRRIAELADSTIKEVRDIRWDLLTSGKLKQLQAEDVLDWPEDHTID